MSVLQVICIHHLVRIAHTQTVVFATMAVPHAVFPLAIIKNRTAETLVHRVMI
ncbi:MAG: hypothetical protein IT524_04250 [Nitrosomonas sp.]|uniref:hypothetical protein n=1 Tax=Nitrosomonas sp. JL21 TaxID=153949 RepID=UPI001370C3F2|nr:hypothetical protein [Nitrosomonas sp. JL21]MBL8498354.1 hypothetical protein [Nitrosomonas sp.]MCC7091163.1 hypothetical protein [Nitrosomonas sp.]